MSGIKRWKKTCALCFTSDNSVSYFNIPTNERRQEWLRLCNITWEIPKTAKLCAKHFSTESFTKNSDDTQYRKRLKVNAVPTQFLEHLDNHEKIINDEDEQSKITTKNKWCFICGPVKDPKRSYHRFPKEVNYRNLWLSKLGKEESSMQVISNSRLCSVHFSPNNFLENPRTGKRYLKQDAVPIDMEEHMSISNENCNYHLEGTGEPILHLSLDQISVSNNSVTTPVKMEISGGDILVNSDASFREISGSFLIQPQSTPQRVSLLTHDKACQTEDNWYTAASSGSCITPYMQMSVITTPSTSDCKVDISERYLKSNTQSAVTVTPTTSAYCEDPLDVHSYAAFENGSKHPLPFPRYVGDIRTPHLATPKRAKKCLQMSKDVIELKNKTIASLSRKLKTAQEKIKTLNDFIYHLGNTNYISETEYDLLVS